MLIQNHYNLFNNIIFIKPSVRQKSWKIYIPDSMTDQITIFYHENYGHMGRNKTKKCIDEHNYFKNMDKHISRIIRSCDICQKAKFPNCNYNSETFSIISKHKLEQVFIDISGPFPPSRERYPKKFILIMVDNFTKYVKLYPMHKANTKTILKIILNDYIKVIGKPKSIVSDHGTQFKGKLWQQTLIENDIKSYKTSVYHPQSNISERVLREVNRLLRTYCHNKHTEWSKYLNQVEKLINVSYHESIDITPHQAMYGVKPDRLIETLIQFPTQDEPGLKNIHEHITRHLLLKAQQRKEKRDKKQHMKLQYEIGQKVLIRNRQLPSTIDRIMKKLILIYEGPYVIVDIKANNVYKINYLESNRTKGYYNCNQIKPYYER